ncbi:PREDICTED: zinc finger protein ZIC 3-like [Polistes dominula]|uniref:Zinc finger protein ZIC 3-like n=1 Tax=Polistes dominula TaxID=743375 RepID=A0ABM1J0P9_POLDO|nr:PREDICTED: zinc finger protein ZIC 3-like [Polistes dominula]
MIVYVPGRMPSHVGPYGAARYPGTLLGTIPGFYNPVSGYSNSSYYDYGGLSQQQHHHNHHQHHQQFHQQLQGSLNLPVWPRRMPAEEELPNSPSVVALPGLGISSPPTAAAAAAAVAAAAAAAAAAGLGNGGPPPSPAQSDSDASSSSLEVGSVRRGENAQLKCRWQNCGRWFTSLEQLAGHVARLHATPGARGLFYCGWEGCVRGERGFNARYKMLVHVRTHTNEKPHHCCECDKSFSRAENLKIHARSHTGERPYVCPVEGCNKAYSNSSDRFKHTRTHAVDKPYCCKVPGCPKRYTDPSSLRKHVKTYRHYVNNNDKVQDKSLDDNHLQDKTRFDATSPEKQNSTTHSESDKKDSSIESSNTSCSSPKASNSFEEQKNFVEWNNMYNLQDQRKENDNIVQNSYEQDVKIYSNLYDDSYIIPDRIQMNPIYSNRIDNTIIKDCSSIMSSPRTSPGYVPEKMTARIGMQSTPIKTEDEPMECQSKISTVDYRNIDSIVNSTPCKKDNNNKVIGCDIIRNSVIKRAEDVVKMEVVVENKLTKEETNKDIVEECCCRHKCCVHSKNSILEQTRMLSDFILKSQNPLFRHLLGSVDLQYGLEDIWSNMVDNTNICGQDLRVKNENITEMEEDLPLDLTISK